MTATLDDFAKVSREVEEISALLERAAGAYEELLRRLKEDHGLRSLQEAERALQKAARAELETLRLYSEGHAAFWEEFGPLIERYRDGGL